MTVYALDLFGVFVFAISGAMAAERRRMDIFGFVVIALLPALGGGTIRDVIIDVPVFWLSDFNYVLVSIVAATLTFLAANSIKKAQDWLIWADAIGLSLFCVLGASKAIDAGQSIPVALTMGVITAVVGGIVRDVVCNEVPLVLRRDIYATAAIAGATGYLLLISLGLPEQIAIWLGAAGCFAVRSAAIVWKLSLPRRGSR